MPELRRAHVGWRAVTRDGRQPTLWAISDLHTGHTGNKPITESLYPSTPDDWLIVAGDVGERTDEMREHAQKVQQRIKARQS